MRVVKLKLGKWLYAVVPMLLVLILLAYPVFMSVNNSASSGENEIDEISGDAVSASDKVAVSAKYAWGIKRGSNGSLPEVGSKESSLLEKYGGCYLGKQGEKKIYLTFDWGP